jgi:hypothetical protein
MPLSAILLALLGVVSALLVAATIDYHAWVNFGTGGTPANIQGYLKITKFRLLRFLAKDSLKDASMLPLDGPSHIPGRLSKREGLPPKILSRTLPQRQDPRPLEPAVQTKLHDLPKKYAAKYPDLLKLDLSVTEGRSTMAIYSKAKSSTRAYDSALGDEIAHVHPAENSLHVWLTTADTEKVVEAGWGERFPLASLGIVDEGWTFLYAPRSMADLEVIEAIVKAGIGHLTGKDVM